VYFNIGGGRKLPGSSIDTTVNRLARYNIVDNLIWIRHSLQSSIESTHRHVHIQIRGVVPDKIIPYTDGILSSQFSMDHGFNLRIIEDSTNITG
jgi:hypothetical protein